ncbi:MAG: type II toxin-antitoxin system RelE/ParE family toxin [Paraperlucidibaca sp.]
MKLLYSDQAIADLVRLRAFIAKKDPSAAARVAADLIARIDNICLFPEIGKAVALAPDPKTVRDFIFGKYVVRYVLNAEAVIILRIWHQHESR